MIKNFFAELDNNPIICSIKNDEDLELVIKNKCKIIFVLYGNILNINSIVTKLHSHDKIVFVNVDLIDGFSSRDIILEYLKKHTSIDGILSSKASLLKSANTLGFLTIHRLFIIDSFSFSNIQKQVSISKPTCIEVLPGCMPKVLSWIQDKTDIPLIAAGLVCEKEDVVAALGAGCIAISSTNHNVWDM